MNKKLIATVIISSIFILSSVCFCTEESVKEPSIIMIEDAVICRGIVDRIPEEPGDVFPGDLKKIYCYTRVVGANADTVVNHNWYCNGVQVASVPLFVRSTNWRTFSSKNISDDLKGEWKVEVVLENRELLQELKFEIQ